MNPSEEIDNLIARNHDWRGEMLSKLRKIILEADHEIIEEWKWMGSPVWSKNGIICVGNIFKDKVKLVFANGAALADPDKVFNADLAGNGLLPIGAQVKPFISKGQSHQCSMRWNH